MNASDINPQHFEWSANHKIATVTLNRPDRKNPLTFDSYAELRDTFRQLVHVSDVKAVIFTGKGDNFCSGGDVHDIIGPLINLDMKGLLSFTRMTGDLVKAMRECPQPIIAAIDGICAGAGACIAMASDIRYGTARSKVAFLFNRVGLERWGFYNRIFEPKDLLDAAKNTAERLANGPTFANGVTKMMLNKEWNMGMDEFIEAEAQAQAICMQTQDFKRAYNAFISKEKPVFEGN